MSNLLHMRISRITLYWVLQLSAWLGLGIFTLLMFVAQGDSSATGMAAPVAGCCLLGLLLTHQFRLHIKRRNWYHLPAWRLVLQVLAANVLMALCLDGAILAYGLLTGFRIDKAGEWLEIGGYVVNTSLFFLFWSLLYFAMYAFRNYRLEEITRLRAEHHMRESELLRLKSQLNPHFVFNALNSIRALVSEDPERAQASITQLSQLLRQFLLSDKNKLVTITEELRTTQRYLELEQLRYEHRLHFELHADGPTLDALVPTMMIQTLAENAVKHGVAQHVEGGQVAIKAWMEAGQLCITIANTGALPADVTPSKEGGYGLANTRQRLSLLYGKAAEFTLADQQNGWVVATLRLPAKQAESRGVVLQ